MTDITRWGIYYPDFIDFEVPVGPVVEPPNLPPTPRQTPDQQFTTGVPLPLSAATSSDPDGDALGFSWEITSSPLGANPTISAGVDGAHVYLNADLPGEYHVRVIVDDGVNDPVAHAGRIYTAVGGSPGGGTTVGDLSTAFTGTVGPASLWVGSYDNPGDPLANFHLATASFASHRTIGNFSIPGSHGNVIRVTHPAGVPVQGYSDYAWFTDLGFPGRDEALYRYRFYVSSNTDWANGGKMPGLAGKVPGSGPITEIGSGGDYYPTSWSGRCLFQGDHGLSTYLYVYRIRGQIVTTHVNNGQIYGWSDRFKVGGNVNNTNTSAPNMKFNVGAWNTVELYYRMNTLGQQNGTFMGWMNGQLGVTLTNIEYRQSNQPNLNINVRFFSNFYGGSVAPATQQFHYFDDPVITNGDRLAIDEG